MTKMEGQLLVMEVERHTGFEPAPSVWEAVMLPLTPMLRSALV